MANVNRVTLIGNLTREPELRFTPKGTAICEISLAINRVWNNEAGQRQEETTFCEVDLWNKQAELVHKYVQKGHSLYVEGRLKMESWDDKTTGQKRSKLKVVAENVQLMNNEKRSAEGSAPAGQTAQQQRPQSSQSSPPLDDYDDSDCDPIPF